MVSLLFGGNERATDGSSRMQRQVVAERSLYGGLGLDREVKGIADSYNQRKNHL